MLPKAHLTLYSRMSGSRWVITQMWLSGSWSSFLYSSVYSCHLFLISPTYIGSIPFLSFIVPIVAWNVLGISKFLEDISKFLEDISNLSQSIVFLYFFTLIAEEAFLISSCYSLELCKLSWLLLCLVPWLLWTYSRALVLNQGRLLPSGNIWQRLETFLVVTICGVGAAGI